MNFEQSTIDQKKEDSPKKLEDMLPFIKPTEEEVEFENQTKKAIDLMSSGKIDEAIALSTSLGENKPKRKDFTEKDEKTFLNARAKIAEQLGYKVTTNDGKFFTLEKDGYHIQMKHFMRPSGGGYDSGRILEIEISKGKINSTWDNGWNRKLKDEDANKIFDEIVNYFN